MRAQLWYSIWWGEGWGEGMHSGRGKPRWARGWTDSATLHASITLLTPSQLTTTSLSATHCEPWTLSSHCEHRALRRHSPPTTPCLFCSLHLLRRFHRLPPPLRRLRRLLASATAATPLLTVRHFPLLPILLRLRLLPLIPLRSTPIHRHPPYHAPPPSNCPPLPCLPSPPSSGHSAPAELAHPRPLRSYSRHPSLPFSPSSPPPSPPCSPASTAAGRRAERRISINARATLVPLRAARAHIPGVCLCVPSFTPPPFPCSSGGVDSPASPLQPPVHPPPMKAFAVLDPQLPAVIPSKRPPLPPPKRRPATPLLRARLHLLLLLCPSTPSDASLSSPRRARLVPLRGAPADDPAASSHRASPTPRRNGSQRHPSPPHPSLPLSPHLTPFGPSSRQGVCCPRPALPQVTPPAAYTFAHQTAGRARLFFFFSFQPPPTPPSLLLPTRRPFQLSASQELCRWSLAVACRT